MSWLAPNSHQYLIRKGRKTHDNLYDLLKLGLEFPFVPKKYNPLPRANFLAVFRPSCLWAQLTILYLKTYNEIQDFLDVRKMVLYMYHLLFNTYHQTINIST